MAIFIYRAMDKMGNEIKKSITSDSLANAKTIIKSKGLLLVDIKEKRSDALKNKTSTSISFGNAVGIEDLSLMTRQLATLIKAKIQIVESLSALVEQSDNPKLKLALSEIKQKVNEGSSLANALAGYPKIFNNIYINMVEAGEASGNLEVVLLRLADFTESQRKLKNKIQGAMTYPIIMAVVGSLMMSIIFIFVIPKITKIFITMKKTLPLQTKICIWISETLQNQWFTILITLFGIYYFGKKYINTKSGKSNWDHMILKLPLIGKIVTMINVARFTSTLSTLLDSGVPILMSMKIVSNLVSNVHMKKAIEESRENISEGASMTLPLVSSQLFPPMMTHMMSLGEKSGELTPMLNIIAETYEEQVDTKLTGLTATLEPIMMVFMGIVVAFIIFSVVVPMMELNKLK